MILGIREGARESSLREGARESSLVILTELSCQTKTIKQYQVPTPTFKGRPLIL